MEPTGIRRKVDDLGRIVIPAPMRRALGLAEGDELDVRLDGDRLILSRPQDRCTFCGGADALEDVLGKTVCRSCAAAIRAADREWTAPGPFGT